MTPKRKILASLGLLAALAFTAYLYRVPLAMAASPVELWFGVQSPTGNGEHRRLVLDGAQRRHGNEPESGGRRPGEYLDQERPDDNAGRLGLGGK